MLASVKHDSDIYIYPLKISCYYVNLLHNFICRYEVFISDSDSSLCRSIALGGNLQGIMISTN